MSTFLFIICLFLAFVVISNADRLTLEEKVYNLQNMLTKKHIIKLNSDQWNLYVHSAPKNYSVVVLFTLLSPKSNCIVCK